MQFSPKKATFYYQWGMIYGTRGNLKKEKEVTKEISDPCVEKGRNFATNPEALTSRALGLIGNPPTLPPSKRIQNQYYTAHHHYSKVWGSDFLYIKHDPDLARWSFSDYFRGARRGCSVLRHGCGQMDVVAAEGETRVGEGTRRFETLSIWQERGE